MKKIWYILFIALFFIACIVPTAGMLIAGPSEAAANEIPAAVPRVKGFDGSWNRDFFTNLRDYVGKGFFLRLEGITGWDTILKDVFRTSGNDDVLIGPDGWLFYGAAVNDISGANQMTDRQIWCAARGLALMQEYAESRGARFLFAVPCGKYTLYPNHAPDFVTVAEGSNRERLAAAMAAQGVHYADLYSAFSSVDEALYWQWDSHWTERGAALGADTILAAAGIDSNFFEGPFTEEKSHTGDLYEMLFPRGTELETSYTYADGFAFEYTSNFRNYDDMLITTTCAGKDGSLLLFRDSSGRSLYPYMADSFGAAYISRSNNYRLDLIEPQNATTVVAELAERTLDYLLRYPAVYEAPVRDESVLNGAAAVDAQIAVDTSGSTAATLQKLTGTLPETAVDSPVYVRVSGTVYEAIPNEGGFTLWLPMETDTAGAQAFVFE